MRNISSIISSHNKRVLNPPVTNYGCNCRYKINCPLQNECLTPQIVYKAIVSNDQNNEVKQYIGLTSNTFKERYNGHNTSFRSEKYRKETELSKYVWELKDQGINNYTINWSIVKQIKGKLNSKNCQLCLSEKYYIIDSLDDEKTLNKRDEFIKKCRHQNKTLLRSVKTSGVG